jgi:aspartyl protease family protein
VKEDENFLGHIGAILARHPPDRNIGMLHRRTILSLALALLPAAAAAADLSLYALFKHKAIVQVDGNRRMLTAGGEASPEGVRLISTDTEAEEAVVELDGKRETLKLGVVIAAFTGAARESATLYADPNGSFHAQGSINGVPVTFLVDTGATSVAINSALASRIGIDYARGQPGYAKTASGFTRVYGVQLRTVKVGDITLHNIDAAVIDGAQPDVPLLGMSFLNALEMRRDGHIMELTRRY